MKAATIHAFSLAVLMFGFARSVEAQHYEIQYGIGDRDEYIVVERHRGGTIIVKEPAPQVVIVEAPPSPPPRIVVRPQPPCVGAIWVAGYWRYTGARFVWVRGHWIPPRHGYHFVQPRWHVHAGHHYYTPGYFRPRYTEVRRASYRRYRPRPGYVYYRGYERPGHHRHHPTGHYEHGQRHSSAHRHHGKHRPPGHAKRPPHPSRGPLTRNSRNARPSRQRQVSVVARAHSTTRK